MKTMSNSDAATYASLFVKNRAVANRFCAKCMGQDAAMDDETAARIKEFLSDKLSDKDHTALCAMLNGEDNVEAQDTESPPYDVDAEPRGKLAGDAASFNTRFPGLRHVRLDNSGIQPRARGGSYSDAASSKSFAERYPGLAHIRQR